ncbi:MAG: uncharacterized protein JWQ43_3443 [Glaciihabitans sp.]|nr:uncharacterized protein [Glaciihabitans sp.]
MHTARYARSMSSEHQFPVRPSAPIDPASAERLAADGLRLGLVDTGDNKAFTAWLQAEARGFHEGELSAKTVAEQLGRIGGRRTTGVWDDTAAQPASPIATVSSWSSALTVPGNRSVDSWAISAVTVSPTHRRRGIARAMLESELRTAHSQGFPLAVLTVSEATIYGRFGFAPTAMSVDLSIDTSRAKWTGPRPEGRLHFITINQLHTEGPALLERVRPNQPGQLEMSTFHWDRMVGLVGDSDDTAKNLRAVRFDDADGVAQGFALYTVTQQGTDYFRHVLDVKYLLGVTDDAAAALWQFLLEQDLVGIVNAPLRPVDDPISWQVSDFRAVSRTSERDHLWARILDVPAALSARSYSAAVSVVLDISDPLGFADGRVLLETDTDGAATVTLLTDDAPAPHSSAAVSLGVADLGALYLGGVTAHTLARAGRLVENTPGGVAMVDAAFRSASAPFCDFWF